MATSAGILVYRHSYQEIEFLLLKPGGPFYKNHENFIWTIPKGEIQENESEVQAARREFNEETGFFISCLVCFLASTKIITFFLMRLP